MLPGRSVGEHITTSTLVIGIIANPASGKDVRRLIGSASVVDNLEKVNVIRRILAGLEAIGDFDVRFMPDHFDIVGRARGGGAISDRTEAIEMPFDGTPADTTRATERLIEMDAACVISLGGDGTARLVGRSCGETPVVAVSTGTNNALPTWIDGTAAGLAAGLVARRLVDLDACAPRAKQLSVRIERATLSDETVEDIALVDVAISPDPFVSARALWEPRQLRELFLTRAEPGSIGLSAIGAHLSPVHREEAHGLWLRFGPGGTSVRAPIVPGLIQEVQIEAYRMLDPDSPIRISGGTGAVALDGEKEHAIYAGDEVIVSLGLNGPRIVEIRRTIEAAARAGHFQSVPEGKSSESSQESV